MTDLGSMDMTEEGTEATFAIAGGKVAVPEGWAEDAVVRVVDGRIADVSDTVGDMTHVVDATGQIVAPGLIDLHSDAIEKTIKPRPRAVFPLEMAVAELDKALVACGVTTMYHCIAFSNSTDDARSHQEAVRRVEQLEALIPRLRARTRVHARYDITAIGSLDTLREMVDAGRVGILSFMDHTPGQGQFRDLEAFADYCGRHHQFTMDEVKETVAKRLRDRDSVDERALASLANMCLDRGVPMASHDDDTSQKVEWVSSMGVSISEFPVTHEAARAASAHGMTVAMGSPNVVLGGSTSDNLSATAAIADGVVGALCSDYVPMTLLHALFTLERQEVLSLRDAFRLVTERPAAAAGLQNETGSIQPGKRADLIIVATDPDPTVVRTYIDGRMVYATTS